MITITDDGNGIEVPAFEITLADKRPSGKTPGPVMFRFPGFTDDDFRNLIMQASKVIVARVVRGKYISKVTGEDKKVTVTYDDEGMLSEVQNMTEFNVPKPGTRGEVKKSAVDSAIDLRKKYGFASREDFMDFLEGSINIAELAKRHFVNFTKWKEEHPNG